LRACFIPLPRPGFTPQGISPLPSRPDSSSCRPLLSITDLRLQPSCPDCPAPTGSPPGV
jgi:hypothetical protein